MPRTLKLRHVDPDADYRQGAVEARRLAGEGRAVSEVSFAVSMTSDEAQALAEGMLIEASVARERAEFALPPSLLAIEPGDLVRLAAHGRETLLRLDEIGEAYSRAAKATRADPQARDFGGEAVTRRPPPNPARAVAPAFLALDLPVITGDEPPHALRLAAYARPWTPMSVFRSEDGESFVFDQTLNVAATIGELVAPLGRHDSGRFDRLNALEVEVGPDRSLESRSVAAVLDGANLAAVRCPSGAWELLQFSTAELVAPGRWRLSGLLRGQFGTEDAIGDPTPAGAAFALIDAASSPSSATESARGRAVAFAAGPATLPRDDEAYVETIATFGARGLLPYAPVRLAARRDPATGDVEMTWVRRSRVGGDDFEIREIRLGEESEAYEVSILGSGGAVVRVIASATPAAIYPQSQQIGDFGSAPATLTFAVRQLSATVGPGLPATATVAL